MTECMDYIDRDDGISGGTHGWTDVLCCKTPSAKTSALCSFILMLNELAGFALCNHSVDAGA